MRIVVDNYNIECFETEQDYKYWMKDHAHETHIMNNVIYKGEVYGIPTEIRNLFRENILVSIKMKCHTDTQYVLIHK